MIDLHLHTTASDGRYSADELVEYAARAGVSVMAVTDHDTTAAIADVSGAARARGIEAISGIEITAIDEGRDVHILGPLYGSLREFCTRCMARPAESRIAVLGARSAPRDPGNQPWALP